MSDVRLQAVTAALEALYGHDQAPDMGHVHDDVVTHLRNEGYTVPDDLSGLDPEKETDKLLIDRANDLRLHLIEQYNAAANDRLASYQTQAAAFLVMFDAAVASSTPHSTLDAAASEPQEPAAEADEASATGESGDDNKPAKRKDKGG